MSEIIRTGPNVVNIGRYDTLANLITTRTASNYDPGTMAYTDNAGWMFSDGLSWRPLMTESIIALTATYTLTSTTNSQALFNVPANGALTLPGATSYFFDCMFSLSSMSATSGNMGFDILGAGTATLTSSAWVSGGSDGTTLTTPAADSGIFSATNANTGDIVIAGTGTAVSVMVNGIFRTNAAGTIIPSVKLTTAATAVVGVNSFFRCRPFGSNAVTYVGNWA